MSESETADTVNLTLRLNSPLFHTDELISGTLVITPRVTTKPLRLSLRVIGISNTRRFVDLDHELSSFSSSPISSATSYPFSFALRLPLPSSYPKKIRYRLQASASFDSGSVTSPRLPFLLAGFPKNFALERVSYKFPLSFCCCVSTGSVVLELGPASVAGSGVVIPGFPFRVKVRAKNWSSSEVVHRLQVAVVQIVAGEDEGETALEVAGEMRAKEEMEQVVSLDIPRSFLPSVELEGWKVKTEVRLKGEVSGRSVEVVTEVKVVPNEDMKE